jgi:Asp-tRNA(Asn)/Glu-tRNA(Gln) amidotransferase A subunit family amidase
MASSPDRRLILKGLAGLGLGTATWRRALAVQVAEAAEITPAMIANAEWIAGIELSDEERETITRSVQRVVNDIRDLRSVPLGYEVTPCLSFSAAPWLPVTQNVRRHQARPVESRASRKPDTERALAFLPVTELSALLRSGQVTSTELTRLYLDRLRKHDPLLRCVVTLTESLALERAARADREMASGRWRGPLHGIPWGAKDLIAYPGFPTTWGAPQFQHQQVADPATVARRLDEAGAVLVAKLSLGALAQGDQWFGGQTKNPWNPEQGSSGSSAGSAAAVAAGLVGFALGSETLGSIVSPCRRCGATGLRPTFGRVSRHGCMSLAWSMDKIGPIARSVEDCALILDAIHGFDGHDPTAVDQPFRWPSARPLGQLRVGYVPAADAAEDQTQLEVLRSLGVRLVPIRLPDQYPVQAVTMMLGTEAGAVFDPLTRAGDLDGLNSWPNSFRRAQFVPAVEYLRASRVRTLLMRQMRELFEQVDLYTAEDDLALTNLTGHPTVVLPNGLRQRDGARTPTAITFTGRLFGESELLAVAHAYQQATGHHLDHPDVSES